MEFFHYSVPAELSPIFGWLWKVRKFPSLQKYFTTHLAWFRRNQYINRKYKANNKGKITCLGIHWIKGVKQEKNYYACMLVTGHWVLTMKKQQKRKEMTRTVLQDFNLCINKNRPILHVAVTWSEVKRIFHFTQCIISNKPNISAESIKQITKEKLHA